MKMIDLVVREQGRERKIVQPAVISWMVKTGKFKRAKRSTYRKRITRFFKARQHEALMRNEALARILAGI